MKNLLEFIKESLQINESATKSIWDSDRDTSDLRFKIKEFFNTSQDCLKPNKQGKKRSMDNETDRTDVLRGLIKYCNGGYSEAKFRSILNQYGLATENGLRNFILSNGKKFEEQKWNMKWCLQYDLTALEAEYKRAKKAGEIPDAVSDEEAEDRDLVIYDRWNPETHAVYSFIGKRGKATEHQVNMIRMDFRYDFDVKYYDCYPILAKNYYNKVDELKKRAELQLGYDDPNEFK